MPPGGNLRKEVESESAQQPAPQSSNLNVSSMLRSTFATTDLAKLGRQTSSKSSTNSEASLPQSQKKEGYGQQVAS